MSHRFVHALEPLETRTLLSGGDLDASFGAGGRANVNFTGFNFQTATSVDVANGRVVVGGVADPDAGGGMPPRVALAVLDSGGNLVPSFSGDGRETESLSVPGGVIDLVVQPDNKIVVLAGTPGGPTIVTRFNVGGSLDTAFGQRAVPFGDGRAIALAPNGDVVVAGRTTTNAEPALARFGSNGTPKGSVVVTDLPDSSMFDVAVLPDGSAVAVGLNQAPIDFTKDGIAVRIKADMTGLDTNFDGDGILRLPDAGPEDAAHAVTVDSQGRVLVGFLENARVATVVRVLATGAIDPSFAASRYEGDPDNTLTNIAFASGTGKVTVSGEDQPSGQWYVARFNANGGTDTTFGGGDGAIRDLDDFEEVAGPFHDVQPDGKVVTLGDNSAVGGGGPLRVFRHQNDGSSVTGSVVLEPGGIVRVTGTDNADLIEITDPGAQDPQLPTQSLFIRANGRTFSVERQLVNLIVVDARGGNDRVINTQSVLPAGQAPRGINAGPGNDEIHGGSANDNLIGLDGNDRIFGHAGDDLVDGGQGTDLQDGGSGADTVDYSFRNSAVFVDLQGDADDGPAGERDTVAANVEHILGGRGNDTLTGNGNPNFIRGNGGNDTIRGGGNNDTLVGGAGQDRLFGDAGDDFLDAADGITDLVLDGGTGFDRAKKDNNDPRTSIEELV